MNKARINKNGYLLIKRAKEFKSQLCPKQKVDAEFGSVGCGDWCPLFGEIEDVKDRQKVIIGQKLTLCSGAFIGRINDNRGNE